MIDKIGFYLAAFTVCGLVLISGYFGIKSGKFLGSKMEEAIRLDRLDRAEYAASAPSKAYAPPAPAPAPAEASPSLSKKKASPPTASLNKYDYDTGTHPIATPVPPPLTALPSVEASKTKATLALDNLETQKFYVKAAFSSLILIASLFIVIKGGSPESVKWAFGSVGTILGYWLK